MMLRVIVVIMYMLLVLIVQTVLAYLQNGIVQELFNGKEKLMVLMVKVELLLMKVTTFIFQER